MKKIFDAVQNIFAMAEKGSKNKSFQGGNALETLF